MYPVNPLRPTGPYTISDIMLSLEHHDSSSVWARDMRFFLVKLNKLTRLACPCSWGNVLSILCRGRKPLLSKEQFCPSSELWSHCASLRASAWGRSPGASVCAILEHTHTRPLLVFHDGLIRWGFKKLTWRSLTFIVTFSLIIWKLIR